MNYPFVEKGKKYDFHFEVKPISYKNDDDTITEAYITVAAKGELGEYRVENADKIKVSFSNDSKIISRSALPEFTVNPKVKVQSLKTQYYICREKEDREGFTQDWWIMTYELPLIDETSLSFDLHDSKEISGWRGLEDIDLNLSGHKYKIITQTMLYVNNISDYDGSYNTCFYMNDGISISGNWGGEVAKVALVYGVNDNKNSKFKFTGEELSEVTGLPGSSVTMEYKGDTVTYPYVSLKKTMETIIFQIMQ